MYIAVDGLWLEQVHLHVKMIMRLAKVTLSREQKRIQPVGHSVNVGQGVHLGHVTIGRHRVHPLVAENCADECLMVKEATKRVHLLVLQLVLNALAIGSIRTRERTGQMPSTSRAR